MYPSLFRLSETKKLRLKWVGLISTESYTAEEQEKIRVGIEQYNAYPVFVDKKVLDDFTSYYDSVVSPVFHNFISYKKNASARNAELLQSYRVVNKCFVEAVLTLYKKEPKAIVLFNDPYFLLAPKLVPEMENLHMGYFFHSPFPSCEIFRIFPSAHEVSHGC